MSTPNNDTKSNTPLVSASASTSAHACLSCSVGQAQEDECGTRVVEVEERMAKKLKSNVWEHYNHNDWEISSNSDTSTRKYDENVERRLFVQMVAKHDFPFQMVEDSYFRVWVSYIYPSYEHRSVNTLREDLDMVYEEEKNRIYEELEEVSSRVSLTVDCWKPFHQKRSYFCLTCHFIDSDWTLHKRMIDFHVVPFPHNGPDLRHWLKGRILEWNLDKKMSSVVVDDASYNLGILEGVKSWLNRKKALMSNGDMFRMHCVPHILDLIAKSGLEMLHGFIQSIKMTQRYISKSLQREEKFSLALQHCKFSTEIRIPLEDVDTRWNSTYQMLVVAIKLKDVIKHFGVLDPGYTYLPSDKEWEDGEKICDCLKVFDEKTTRHSRYRYPTANYYFPEIQSIHKKIKDWGASKDETISLMAAGMQVEFDKYWDECNKLLTVAAVLDPRFKMHIVNFFFRSIYGNHSHEYEEESRVHLFNLYSQYKEMYGAEDMEESGGPKAFGSENPSSASERILKDLVNFLAETNVKTGTLRKSELEEYLDEALHPLVDRFDILKWWKCNGPRYPILSRMARDIFAIPTSSVASEPSFAARGSSLHSETVERLMCLKDWLPDIKLGDLPKGKAVATESEVNLCEDDWISADEDEL